MAIIKLRLAARCEAAGREENEDNYQISENLSEGKWSFTTDEEIDLSKLGTLLVVADGMGGLNAGEIASALAIDTVKEWFSPVNLSRESFEYPSQIKSYIKKTIQAADQKIKSAGEKDRSISGMGSTIVLAWIIDDYIYIGWCGDSRAYRYNQADGFIQLSHDHSYVQELVDRGKLKPELAFDFPDRNIITRSLGDTRRKANPDVLDFPLHNGDLFLLCSDGLSGVLRDEQLAEVIAANTDNLRICRDALWKASFEAEWDDNVTLILCQILSVVEAKEQVSTVKIEQPEEKPAADIVESTSPPKKRNWKIWLTIGIIILALAAVNSFRHDLSSLRKKWVNEIKKPSVENTNPPPIAPPPATPIDTPQIGSETVKVNNEKKIPEDIKIDREGKSKKKEDKPDTKPSISTAENELSYEDENFKARFNKNNGLLEITIIKSDSIYAMTNEMLRIVNNSFKIEVETFRFLKKTQKVDSAGIIKGVFKENEHLKYNTIQNDFK